MSKSIFQNSKETAPVQVTVFFNDFKETGKDGREYTSSIKLNHEQLVEAVGSVDLDKADHNSIAKQIINCIFDNSDVRVYLGNGESKPKQDLGSFTLK